MISAGLCTGWPAISTSLYVLCIVLVVAVAKVHGHEERSPDQPGTAPQEPILRVDPSSEPLVRASET